MVTSGVPSLMSVAYVDLLPSRHKPLVLVVDDDDHVRGVVVKALRRVGVQVISACDGREGLRQFELHAQQIGMVILDYAMPELNGAQVFDELRRLAPELPIVLISGNVESQMVEQLLQRRLSAFLSKPFAIADLYATIRHALARHS